MRAILAAVATVHFTQNLRRHVASESMEVEAGTVAEALATVFARSPALRGYVVDDQGAVRHHMNIFVDGEMISDRRRLSDPVREDSEIYVMQALSGG